MFILSKPKSGQRTKRASEVEKAFHAVISRRQLDQVYPHTEYSILTFDPKEERESEGEICFSANFRINERHNRGGKPCAYCIWSARFLWHLKIYCSDGQGDEEMIGQVHALKSCIRLSLKWRRVSGLKNHIGHVCLAFIQRIPQGLGWGEAFIIMCYNNADDFWNFFRSLCNPPRHGSAPTHRVGREPGTPAREADSLTRNAKGYSL